jgi:biotin transport system substrate-specific component
MNKPVSGTKGAGMRFSVRQIAVVGLMAAVTCILAPLSVPIGPVPISLTNLAVYVSLYVLGMKEGTLSYVVYLLIGLVGVPVFSGFTSGPEKLFGPTGGYLIGFIPMAVLAGIVVDKYYSNRIACFAGLAFGTVVCYGLGTAWLSYQAGLDWKAALFAGVVPFIPGDLAKITFAVLAGPKLKRQLAQAGLG